MSGIATGVSHIRCFERDSRIHFHPVYSNTSFPLDTLNCVYALMMSLLPVQ